MQQNTNSIAFVIANLLFDALELKKKNGMSLNFDSFSNSPWNFFQKVCPCFMTTQKDAHSVLYSPVRFHNLPRQITLLL